jgi:hypothetical protein
MWKRDPAVSTMIEYLDRDLPLKYKLTDDEWIDLPTPEKFSLLSPADRKAVLEQAKDCTEDFTYASRNYFHIVNKDKQDQLFSLWEGQHLILQCYYDLKAKGQAQKIMVIKARQLGASLLIEAMIAWRAMFFPNTNGLVVGRNAQHAAYLFSLMLYIYDHLPWWLKPESASREEKDRIHFDRRDPKLRGPRPGMNSIVTVQNFEQYSGVGQGTRLDCAHASEYAEPLDDVAEEVINEDLKHALSDRPDVFGFLESTGKGTGRFAHRLWRAMEQRLEQGKRPDWYPLFLPSFFETTRVMAPPNGWHMKKPEADMLARVKKEWLRCNDAACQRYRPVTIAGESAIGTRCPECNRGTLLPVILTTEQLVWMEDGRENAEAQSKKAARQYKQELCVTAEQAFQLSGYVLFDDPCQEWMDVTVGPPLMAGRIYATAEIHGADAANGDHCYISGCTNDHRHDETPLHVWEKPIAGCEYCAGVDVSEGIGEDYSVIFINKIGKRGMPDEQVAVWRDNRTDPKTLGFYANVLGRWYNDALMCIEYNIYQTTGDEVAVQLSYPNIFRWKHLDSLHPLSGKMHWYTKVNTKSYLHQTAKHWLQNRVWIIRSKNFKAETTTYQKEDYGSRSMGAAEGFFDDEVLAGMISLYCAHEMDCDESGRVPVPGHVKQEEPATWQMTCKKCKQSWGSSNPEGEYRCPYEGCESIGPFTAVYLQTPDPTPTLKSNDERPIMEQVKDMVGKDVDRFKGTSFDLLTEHKAGVGAPDVPYDML